MNFKMQETHISTTTRSGIVFGTIVNIPCLCCVCFFFDRCSFNKTKQRLSQRWWWGRFRSYLSGLVFFAFLFISSFFPLALSLPLSFPLSLPLFFSRSRSCSFSLARFSSRVSVVREQMKFMYWQYEIEIVFLHYTHLRNNVARFVSMNIHLKRLAQLDKLHTLPQTKKNRAEKKSLPYAWSKNTHKIQLEFWWENSKKKICSETWNFIRLW